MRISQRETIVGQVTRSSAVHFGGDFGERGLPVDAKGKPSLERACRERLRQLMVKEKDDAKGDRVDMHCEVTTKKPKRRDESLCVPMHMSLLSREWIPPRSLSTGTTEGRQCIGHSVKTSSSSKGMKSIVPSETPLKRAWLHVGGQSGGHTSKYGSVSNVTVEENAKSVPSSRAAANLQIAATASDNTNLSSTPTGGLLLTECGDLRSVANALVNRYAFSLPSTWVTPESIQELDNGGRNLLTDRNQVADSIHATTAGQKAPRAFDSIAVPNIYGIDPTHGDSEPLTFVFGQVGSQPSQEPVSQQPTQQSTSSLNKALAVESAVTHGDTPVVRGTQVGDDIGVHRPGNNPCTSLTRTTPLKRDAGDPASYPAGQLVLRSQLEPAHESRFAPSERSPEPRHTTPSINQQVDTPIVEGTQMSYRFKTWYGQPAVKFRLDDLGAPTVVTVSAPHMSIQHTLERGLESLGSPWRVEFDQPDRDDGKGSPKWNKPSEDDEGAR